MLPVIDCEGAPRDLGFDQGVACGAALVAPYARAPLGQRLRSRAGWTDPHSVRVARDVARHFPRQAEALEGLSRGAGVPRAWLEAQLARASADPTLLGDGLGIAAAASLTGAAALVAIPFRRDWLLRRARPEGGIACLEIAPAWFTGALAAVSEAGVAAAVVPHPNCEGRPAGSPTRPVPGSMDAFGGSSPPTLLVQDALHRTESMTGALEWCLRRPTGGRATLLFADDRGEVAGLRVDGDERRVLRPAEGLLVEAGGAGRAAEVAKAVRDAADPTRALERDAVWLDPVARIVRLGSGAAAGEPEIVRLDA